MRYRAEIWTYEEVCETHCCTCNKSAEETVRRRTCGVYGSKSNRQSAWLPKETKPPAFSKVRSRSNPRIFEELYYWLVQDAMKGRQLRLIAQDSTDVPAYSRKDIYAWWGVRTIPKKRQRHKEKVEYFFGYKLHLNADAEREIPLGCDRTWK